MKNIIFIIIFSILILIIVIIFDSFLIDSLFIENKLVINEYMASNNTIIQDNKNNYSDWIEIYNGSTFPINLNGYGLSDNYEDPLKWMFPDVTMGPDSYLVIFTSGNTNDTEIDYSQDIMFIHTNFKLGTNDVNIVLSTQKGKIIDKIDLFNINPDESFGRNPENSEWQAFIAPTPGYSNNAYGFELFKNECRENSPDIIISEIMASNKSTIIDDNGNFTDWIEIHNVSNAPVHLKNYSLSDDANNLSKWKFPKIIIEPDEYILIFASGQYTKDGDNIYLHTNFKLNSANDSLYLCNPDSTILSSIKIESHTEDISYGINPDSSEWFFYNEPTPGYINTHDKQVELSGRSLFDSDIIINEVMPIGSSVLRDEDFEESDWIELYNMSRNRISLNGMYLSDNSSNLEKWAFPDITISPGQYLIIYASGKNRKGRYLHTNFKLDVEEEIVLSDSSNNILYKISYSRIPAGISCGIDNQKIVYFRRPSPGTRNNQGYTGFSPDIEFSAAGGFYEEVLELELYHSLFTQAPAIIRYTTDGSEPDEYSPVYKSKLIINRTMVIRARCFSDELLPGKTITNSYIINPEHTLPVISLSTDPDNLWNYYHGIYVEGPNAAEEFPHKGANYWQKWEKPAHVEFFEADGTTGFSIDAGLRIFGAFSRGKPQKSLAIRVREKYGESTIIYPIFPERETNIFKSFVLRTSGQDAEYSRIRDSLMCTLAQEIGLDTQSYRPCVVYLNGEYWGHYNIRDKIDEYFLSFNYGLDNPDNVDMIQGNSIIMAGDYSDYSTFHTYVSGHDLSIPENYEYVKTQMDIYNYMDYQIAQMYFANLDNGNIRFWKERSEEGRWRWILFDTDWGFFHTENNTIAFGLDPEGTGYEKLFSNVIIRRLLGNDEFKNMFVNRFVELLNTTFSSEHVYELINHMATVIEFEMYNQINRWGGSMEGWRRNVHVLKEFALNRPAIIYRHLITTFNLNESEIPPLIN